MCVCLCFFENKQLSLLGSKYSALSVESVGNEFVNGGNTTIIICVDK